jgi:hypothetical protein
MSQSIQYYCIQSSKVEIFHICQQLKYVNVVHTFCILYITNAQYFQFILFSHFVINQIHKSKDKDYLPRRLILQLLMYCTMALRFTQPLTEKEYQEMFLRIKCSWCMRLIGPCMAFQCMQLI